MKAGNAPWMGMEKEPPARFGVKVGGKAPLVHSHSMKPRRKVSVGSKHHGRKRGG